MGKQALSVSQRIASILTEEELITLLRQREKRGFSLLYDNYSSALFGVVRRAPDQSQEILCLFNFTPKGVDFPEMKLLMEKFPAGSARDLISGGEITWGKKALQVRPYQALWLYSH